MIVLGLRTFLGGTFKGHFLEPCDTFFGCFLGFIFFEGMDLGLIFIVFRGFGVNFQRNLFWLNFKRTLFRLNIQRIFFGGIFLSDIF